MAHPAVSLPAQKTPPAPQRRGGSLHLLSLSPTASKAAATRLFQKFAARSPLPLGKLRAELIPDSSWKRAEQALRPTAAQTVARLANSLAFSTRTWQSEADAIDWLLAPHIQLGGATPFSMLRTETGGRLVEQLMAALEYGFPV